MAVRTGRAFPIKPHYGYPPAVTIPPPAAGRISRPAPLDGLGGVGQQAFNPLLSLLVWIASMTLILSVNGKVMCG